MILSSPMLDLKRKDSLIVDYGSLQSTTLLDLAISDSYSGGVTQRSLLHSFRV